jgi:hypothetical protein
MTYQGMWDIQKSSSNHKGFIMTPDLKEEKWMLKYSDRKGSEQRVL